MHPQDLDRIRFVTYHFHTLQGLRRAVPGLYFLTIAIIYAATGPGPLSFALIMISGVPTFWLAGRLKSYYANRFGEVERQPPPWVRINVPIISLGLTTPDSGTVFLGRTPQCSSVKNPLAPRGQHVVGVLALALWCLAGSLLIYNQAPTVTAVTLLRFFCLGLSAWSIGTWWQRGSSRWQAHYLVVGVLLLGLVPSTDASNSILLVWTRESLMSGEYPLLGAFLTITGLLDHRILVRTMGLLAPSPGALGAPARAETEEPQ
ncbi:MAG TPA: hypothetical protein VMW75_10625 [Thermoanaerobaculia bacterium]|nr:hypothetical protein [Thermoanaerobaculia bacterium]